MCRPRSAPTRPRVWRDAGSSVGASSAGCWAGWCAHAASTCTRASGRSSGAAAGQDALRVRADRGRRAAVRGSWGYAPRDATGQCGLAPPRTHSPRTGHPGVVTGSGLSTHGELRPRGSWRHGQQAGGGACQASGEGGGGETRCVVRVRCRQRGRQSCAMPLILERRGHPGTFLGVGCPFGTWPQPARARVLTVQCPRGRPGGRAAQRDNGVRPPRQTVTGELRRLVPPRDTAVGRSEIKHD